MAMQSYLTSKIKTKTKTVGGCPTASYFFLRRQEKVTEEKATPVCRRCAVPCVARLVRRLRNSRCALRQSSPTTPDQPPLLGGAQGKKIQNLKIAWRAAPTMPSFTMVHNAKRKMSRLS